MDTGTNSISPSNLSADVDVSEEVDGGSGLRREKKATKGEGTRQSQLLWL